MGGKRPLTVPDVAGTMMLVFSCFGFVAAGVILFTSSSPGPIFYVAMSAGLFFGVTGIIAKRYAASVNKKSKKEPSYKEVSSAEVLAKTTKWADNMELFLYTAGFLTLLSSGVLLLAGAARGESGADPTFLALLGVSVVLLMMGCLPWEWIVGKLSGSDSQSTSSSKPPTRATDSGDISFILANVVVLVTGILGAVVDGFFFSGPFFLLGMVACLMFMYGCFKPRHSDAEAMVKSGSSNNWNSAVQGSMHRRSRALNRLTGFDDSAAQARIAKRASARGSGMSYEWATASFWETSSNKPTLQTTMRAQSRMESRRRLVASRSFTGGKDAAQPAGGSRTRTASANPPPKSPPTPTTSKTSRTRSKSPRKSPPRKVSKASAGSKVSGGGRKTSGASGGKKKNRKSLTADGLNRLSMASGAKNNRLSMASGGAGKSGGFGNTLTVDGGAGAGGGGKERKTWTDGVALTPDMIADFKAEERRKSGVDQTRAEFYAEKNKNRKSLMVDGNVKMTVERVGKGGARKKVFTSAETTETGAPEWTTKGKFTAENLVTMVGLIGVETMSCAFMDDVFRVPKPLRPKHKPYFVYTVTFIQTIYMFYVPLVYGWAPLRNNIWIGPNPLDLISAGSKYTPLIQAGEWWRLITPMFMHAGLVHFAMNMSFQWRVVRVQERLYGTWRMAPIYLIGGIGGTLMSAAFLPFLPMVGASTSLFGCMAILFFDLATNWYVIDKPYDLLFRLLGGSLFSFALGLIPGPDNFGHIGGFMAGALAGTIFLPTVNFGRLDPESKTRMIAWSIPALILLLGSLAWIIIENVDVSGCDICYALNCLPVLEICEILRDPRAWEELQDILNNQTRLVTDEWAHMGLPSADEIFL